MQPAINLWLLFSGPSKISTNGVGLVEQLVCTAPIFQLRDFPDLNCAIHLETSRQRAESLKDSTQYWDYWKSCSLV